ncbi:flagellar hook-length control protein FliK [Methylophaga sp. OBS4]|uniref:flagellar hook-length control protein FliK n=1 Tax=Methylophaga sp. OBS4 TaxID=2991935 RepID=UPI00225B9681|nr:flagellar hook-length control protein FliK [Methylophaga sp. OBS4]MCX4187395.1 flagellar hook-length control protein FliK [Methylophaga sp. OBS4]
MPQPVTIQIDSPMPGAGRKHPAPADNAAVETFSTQFDKQLQSAGNKPAEQSQSAKAEKTGLQPEAAMVEETEKTAADDGKNLPLAEQQIQFSPEDGVDTETHSDNAAENSDAEQAAQSTTLDSDDNKTGVATGAEFDQPKGSAPSLTEKPVRAEVEVSQQAVDHARAAPVAMTARMQPRIGTEVADKAQSVQAKDSPAPTVAQLIEADKAISEEKQAAVSTSRPDVVGELVSAKTEKNAVEAVLPLKADSTETKVAQSVKAVENSDNKPLALRADILEAINRQNKGAKEVPLNLRNLIAARINEQQQQESAAGRQLTQMLDKPPERTAPVLTSAFSLPTTAMSPNATSSAAVTAAAPQSPSLHIQPSLQDAAWSKVMSSRVVWMAKEGVQQAELRLTPANLGPVEVRLHVQNDQASVTFLAQHAATRDALEQALPRLRDSFAESGLELANAEVGEQQHHQQGDESEQTQSSHIFAQASGQDDDIDREIEEDPDSDQVSVGLSLYA